jgi:YbbR domain-containing protein
VLRRLIDWTTTDWALKAISLVLAFLLWTTVRADAPGQWQTEISVRVLNNDADWVVADAPVPSTVTVVFRGPYRELLRAASERPEVIVPVDQVNDSSEVHQLRRSWVRMPPGTEGTDVASFRPEYVRLTFDEVMTRLLPVAAQLQGEAAPGFELAGRIEIEPSGVRAIGARRNLARIDSLRLPPIELRERRGVDTLELTIDTTGTGLIISPRTVRVIVPVRPLLTDTGVMGIRPQQRIRGDGG